MFLSTKTLLAAAAVAGSLLLGASPDAAAEPFRGPYVPVHRAPVVVAPVYRAPVHRAPVFVPAPRVVVVQAPVYAPAYAPVYTPVYTPVYRPVGWRHPHWVRHYHGHRW